MESSPCQVNSIFSQEIISRLTMHHKEDIMTWIAASHIADWWIYVL